MKLLLNYLPSDLYTTDANDKIPDNYKYPLALIQAAQNQKQTNTGGYAKLLKLKIGAKVMLTANIDKHIVELIVKQELLGILNLLKVVFIEYM